MIIFPSEFDLVNKKISQAVQNMDKDFYNNISNDQELIHQIINKLLADINSDLGDIRIYKEESCLVGFLIHFSVNELFKKKLYSLKQITEFIKLHDPLNLEHFKSESKKFALSMSPINIDNGFYLNKIYIEEKYRGTDKAQYLLDHFIEAAHLNNLVPCLHVHKDNFRAIRFYKKYGFSITHSNYDYLFAHI